MAQEKPVQPSYTLGDSSDELDRLISQARFFGDLTAQVLRMAGVGPGMRVLDIGCGAGDVSFLAASLVGPTGSVIGVDRSPDAVALASQRAAAAGLGNIQFLTQDLTELTLDEPVDALIGRLVLMYLADPAVALRRLTPFVRPGGVVVFQEFDLNAATSEPPCPVVESALQRLNQTFRRLGADPRAGLKLSRIFREAGLPAPEMILGARVEQGPAMEASYQLATLTRTLLPLMERTGVATAEEVGIETLADRMREEAVALDAVIVSPSFIGAWSRTAATS